MRLEFIIEEGYVDIKSKHKKYELLCRQLSHLFYIESIDEVLSVLIQNNEPYWEQGYNSTYLNINSNRVRIADSVNFNNIDKNLDAKEDDNIKINKVSGNMTGYIDIEKNLFKRILMEWKNFILKKDNKSFACGYHRKILDI